MMKIKENKMLENKLKWYSSVATNIFVSSTLMSNLTHLDQDPDAFKKVEVLGAFE